MLDYICIVFCIAFMGWNIYAIISEAKRDRRMEQEFRKRMDALEKPNKTQDKTPNKTQDNTYLPMWDPDSPWEKFKDSVRRSVSEKNSLGPVPCSRCGCTCGNSYISCIKELNQLLSS